MLYGPGLPQELIVDGPTMGADWSPREVSSHPRMDAAPAGDTRGSLPLKSWWARGDLNPHDLAVTGT
jgi:hypothetical protein